MKVLLRDVARDAAGVVRVAGSGHCRFATLVAIAVLVGISLDLAHYKYEAQMPLAAGLLDAFAHCGPMQYAHALLLIIIPAFVVLLICGLLRTRKLRTGKEKFFERIEVVDRPAASKVHVIVFWAGMIAGAIYLVVGQWLVVNAGYQFVAGDRWAYLHPAYGLKALSAVSSVGSDILLAAVTLLGTFIFEFLRRLWKQKKSGDRVEPAPPAADIENRQSARDDGQDVG